MTPVRHKTVAAARERRTSHWTDAYGNDLCLHFLLSTHEAEWCVSSHVWTQCFSRVLKKSASGVLASLRGSTYGTEYDSPLRLLRPCWTAILSTLHGQLESSQTSIPVMAAGAKMSFSATC